jgi:hypothetical protein
MSFDVQEFDRFLSDACTRPDWVIVHPLIWNGHWGIKYNTKPFGKFFRLVGKTTKNKYIYWLGIPIYWVKGWKELYPHITAQIIDFSNEDY